MYIKYISGIEKFFDILEEVKKEEQTTIETLFFGWELRVAGYWLMPGTRNGQRTAWDSYQKSTPYGAKGI
jgi:hypothetical protein